MSDLIYRQDAEQAKMEFLNTKVTKETEEQTIHDRAYAEGWNDCNSAYIKAIMELPSAEPERKNGEWIYGENDGQDGWFCSECGFFIPWYYEYYGLDNIDFISDYRTCPKCDANMIKYTGMRGEQGGTEK
jgi:hypothetical protein